MPVRRYTYPHRTKAVGWLTHNAVVARPVNRAELKVNEEARKAMTKESDKLRDNGVWDLSGVQPWAKVCAEAKKNGHKAHVGNVFWDLRRKERRTTEG